MSDILSDQTSLSHFSFYWGVLAESTTSKNQRTLHVYVPALTPMRNGDVSDKGSIQTVQMFNVVTQSREDMELHLARTIEAEYLGFATGQDVPDMYKGQQVLVMNYARGDNWFWMPFERDDYLKTFEHTRIHCADIALVHKVPELSQARQIENYQETERQTALTDDNTYFLEIDTKYRKHVLISTASSDGEKYRYFFKIDATDHSVEIWDTLSSDPAAPHNTFKIESDPKLSTGEIIHGRITLQNESGTTMILEGPDLKINVPRDLSVKVGGKTVVHNTDDVIVNLLKDFHLIITGSVFKQIFGFVKKEICGLYEALFHAGRNQVVQAFDMLEVDGPQTITVTAGRSAQIAGPDVLTAANITVSAGNTIQMNGANGIMLSSTKLISFTAKNIKTSTHIYGCCGCTGH